MRGAGACDPYGAAQEISAGSGQRLLRRDEKSLTLNAMKRQGVTESPAGRWTRAEDYLSAMARKRSFRRERGSGDRTEPESPRLLLSTVPFLGLLALLGVLAVSIMVVAFPGAHPQRAGQQLAHRELGVAPKGWFQEAQREFHH